MYLAFIYLFRLFCQYKLSTGVFPFFKYLKYTQSKEVDIEFEEDACVCLDGEILYSKKLKINVEPLKLRFLLPAGE